MCCKSNGPSQHTNTAREKKAGSSMGSESSGSVEGEERKPPARILEEAAQPSFLPSVNSDLGAANCKPFLIKTRLDSAN